MKTKQQKNIEQKVDVKNEGDVETSLSKNKKSEFLRMVKFTLFSISAGIVQLGLSALFELFTKNWWVVYLIPLVASVLWNFTFNRKFTFKSANNVSLAMTLVAIYYAAFTPASAWWGGELTKLGWANLVVVAFNMIINFITEFLWQRFVVFRKSIDSASKGEKSLLNEGEKGGKGKYHGRLGEINYGAIENEMKALEEARQTKVVDENDKLEWKSPENATKRQISEIKSVDVKKEAIPARKKTSHSGKMGDINYDAIKAELDALEKTRKKG